MAYAEKKLDVPIKFLWNYAGNTIINQHSDINKTHEILQDALFAQLLAGTCCRGPGVS